MITSLNITSAIPEIFLSIASVALVAIFSFVQSKRKAVQALYASIGVLIITLVMLIRNFTSVDSHAFLGMFIVNPFISYAKVLIVVLSIVSLLLSKKFIKMCAENSRFEYPIVVLFAIVGMLVMISSGDFLTMYLGLELQSLSLYVLATFQRKSLKSAEAGLKYVVLGSLASGIFLYGVSLIYGYADSISYKNVAIAFAHHGYNKVVIIALVLVLVGMAFKISAAPFHMWVADVYEGVPLPVTTFFSTAPKVAGLIILLRVLTEPLNHLTHDWGQVVGLLSILSIVSGGLLALRQENMKRMMAYSSVLNIGFLLIPIATMGLSNNVHSVNAHVSILLYLTLYVVANIGVFSVLMGAMDENKNSLTNLKSFSGLASKHPFIAVLYTIYMLSLTGIPPFAGFFAKFYVLKDALSAHLYVIVAFAIVFAVISAFYYIRVIKVMYFDKFPENGGAVMELSQAGLVIATIAGAILAFFFLAPGGLLLDILTTLVR